jgi:hypothetical protein
MDLEGPIQATLIARNLNCRIWEAAPRHQALANGGKGPLVREVVGTCMLSVIHIALAMQPFCWQGLVTVCFILAQS